MECPICYESMIRPYHLKSCSHEVCDKCYRQIKQNSEVIYPFKVPTVKVIPIQCPLCRTKENIVLKPEDYPVEYRQWLELELHKCQYGSWYSIHTVGPSMKELRTELKYTSTKVGRHGFKRFLTWRGRIH
jgi:hypothetical protein